MWKQGCVPALVLRPLITTAESYSWYLNPSCSLRFNNYRRRPFALVFLEGASLGVYCSLPLIVYCIFVL